jgi:small-conductance mechanosensitive channel
MLEWIRSLGGPFADVIDRLSFYLPRLLGALTVVLVGFLAAWGLRFVVVRVLQRGKRLLPGAAVPEEETGVERLLIRVVGGLVFWLVILVSIAVGVEVLGLVGLTDAIQNLASLFPRFIAAVLVLALGLAAGNLTASWVLKTARGANIAYARAAANAVKTSIILVASVVALTQAGIDSTILVVSVGVVLGAFLGAAALAFGLGARTTVSNLVAAHYLKRTYRVNQRIRIGGHEGRILELLPTGVLLETSAGVTLVPAKTFSEETSVLLEEQS